MDPLKERARGAGIEDFQIYTKWNQKGETSRTAHSCHDNAWHALVGAKPDGGVTRDGGEKSCGQCR
jgi:hypothetical protein